MRRWARRSEARRGQSLVEFALTLPILLILLLGILDFGRAVAAYNSVSNAARSAARVAIVNQDVDAIEEAAEAESAFGPVTVVYDGNADPTQTCPDLGCIVEVEVSYTYEPATPVFGAIVGAITVTSASRLPIELCSPDPCVSDTSLSSPPAVAGGPIVHHQAL
jgi:Flp pilus assembly protein TadG